MEQTALQVIPWQAILNSPGSAWAVVFIILLIVVMYQNGKREERLQNTIDNTITRQTDTLSNINTTMIQLKDSMCDVKTKVDMLENELKDIKGELS